MSGIPIAPNPFAAPPPAARLPDPETQTSQQVGFDPQQVSAEGLDKLRLAMAGHAPDSTLVLLDARHLGYRNHYTHKELVSHDGTPTGMVHGVLTSLMALAQCCRTSRMAMLWDGGVDYKRRLFANYKIRHDRQRTPEEQVEDERRRKAFAVTELALGMLDVPGLKLPQGEADDLAGALCGGLRRGRVVGQWPAHFGTEVERVVLVSDDKDWYQMLCDTQPLPVQVWRGAMGKLYTEADFIADHGFGPRLWPDWKGLVGEDSGGDNIPGVPGIGPKNADAMIAAHGGLEQVIQFATTAVASGKPKKREQAIVTHAEQARVSKQLATCTPLPSEMAKAVGSTEATIKQALHQLLLHTCVPCSLPTANVVQAQQLLTQLGLREITAEGFQRATGRQVGGWR